MYGVADTYGWNDHVFGRFLADQGIRRLKYGNGYPETWISHDEIEFGPLRRFIDKNSRNPKIKNKQLPEPVLITVDGGLSRRGVTPTDWPPNFDTPESSQVMFIYDIKPGEGKKKAAWVGSISIFANG